MIYLNALPLYKMSIYLNDIFWLKHKILFEHLLFICNKILFYVFKTFIYSNIHCFKFLHDLPLAKNSIRWTNFKFKKKFFGNTVSQLFIQFPSSYLFYCKYKKNISHENQLPSKNSTSMSCHSFFIMSLKITTILL